jgi:hypothetical protein
MSRHPQAHDLRNDPVYWFGILEIARAGDYVRATEAQRELLRLGFRVNLVSRRYGPAERRKMRNISRHANHKTVTSKKSAASVRPHKPATRRQVKAKKAKPKTSKPDEHTGIADRLVELALQCYRIGRTQTNDAFAVEIDGPNVALMFNGSRDALRSALARAYRRAYGRVPNNTALTDALTTLQGEALDAEPEPVELRAARLDGKIVIDLGDAEGRAVIIGPDGWNVTERSPVLFRRTAVTGVLPVPENGGRLDELRQLLNVTEETWPLALGWLVTALIPDVPHPVLLLGGQQGTGKTTAARKLAGLIDPSPAQLRSQPRNDRQWAITAAGSWIIAIDNVSCIPVWLSDAFCKAVTGDAWVDRSLYSDTDLTVIHYRRPVLLTSIDPGALRGDFGDRTLLVDLEPIDDRDRRTEQEIEKEFEATKPRIFGALLELLARVLAELPHVKCDRLPRMADFGKLLAAMDNVTAAEKKALDVYMGQRKRIAEAVIEADPVALAIEALLEKEGRWEGTMSDLLMKLTHPGEIRPREWPRTPTILGGRLARLTPALKEMGIGVDRLPRSGRRRTCVLTRVQVVTKAISSNANGSPDGDRSSDAGDNGDTQNHNVSGGPKNLVDAAVMRMPANGMASEFPASWPDFAF